MAKNIESDASVESGSIQAPADNIDRASLYEGVSKLGQDHTSAPPTASEALPHYDTKSLYGDSKSTYGDAKGMYGDAKSPYGDIGDTKGPESLPPGTASDMPSAAKGEGNEAGAPPGSLDAEQGAAKGEVNEIAPPPGSFNAEQGAAKGDANAVGAPPGSFNAEQGIAKGDANAAGAPPGSFNAEQGIAKGDANASGAATGRSNLEQGAAKGDANASGVALGAGEYKSMVAPPAVASGGYKGDGQREPIAVSGQNFAPAVASGRGMDQGLETGMQRQEQVQPAQYASESAVGSLQTARGDSTATPQAVSNIDVMGNQRGDSAGLPLHAGHSRVQTFQAWTGSPEGMTTSGPSQQAGVQLEQQAATAGFDQPHRGELIHSPMGDVQPHPVDGAGDKTEMTNSGDTSFANIPPAWQQVRDLQSESKPYDYNTARAGHLGGYTLNGEPVGAVPQFTAKDTVVVQFEHTQTSDAAPRMDPSELDKVNITSPVSRDFSPMGKDIDPRRGVTDDAGNVYALNGTATEARLSEHHKVVPASDVQMLMTPGKPEEIAQARQSIIEQMKAGKQVEKQDVIALARTAPFYNSDEGKTESPFNESGDTKNCMATTAAYMRTYATGKLTNENDIAQLDKWDGGKMGLATEGNVGKTEQEQLFWREWAANSGLPNESNAPIDGVKSLKMVTSPLGRDGAHSMVHIELSDGASILYDPQNDRQYCAPVRNHVKRNSAN